MGKGGQQLIHPSELDKFDRMEWKSPQRPLENSTTYPTIGELKAVVPNHCFERSYLSSFGYVLRDMAWSIGCVYVTNRLLSTNAPTLLYELCMWGLGWLAYSVIMGTIVFGHWVMAHECGHGAFSPSETCNDIVGFVLHQSLLVPYFSWKYSHAKHHRRTNHLSDGESHVPQCRAVVGLSDNGDRQGPIALVHEAFGDSTFASIRLVLALLVGWPLYLAGLRHDKPSGYGVPDHFRPTSKLFTRSVFWKVTLSTVTQFGIIGGLLYAGQFYYGHLTVFLWYWAPYLVTNCWLVSYTLLHHTDPSVPHYGADEWTWVKGALGTIDRPYGIFDYFHHRIGSTHVVHHLFHELPWYHAYEATAAVKPYLKQRDLYNYDPTPIPLALWKVMNKCHYVNSREGVQYYKSLNDVPKTKCGKNG